MIAGCVRCFPRALLLGLATVGCQQDLDRQGPDQRADLPTSQTRDSAGILITENARPGGWVAPRVANRTGTDGDDRRGRGRGAVPPPHCPQRLQDAGRTHRGTGPRYGRDAGLHRHRNPSGVLGRERTGSRGVFDSVRCGDRGPETRLWPGIRAIKGFRSSMPNGRHARSVVLRGNHPEQAWANPSPWRCARMERSLSVMGEEALGSMIVDVWDGDGGLHASLGHFLNSEMITRRGC